MRNNNSNAKKIDDMHFDNVFNRHINFKERVIYLTDDVDEDALSIIEKALDEFDREPEKDVRIRVSSYGGNLYDMFGIIDRIKESPCKIITIGSGKVMSAATFIVAAGNERFAGPNTWFMVHELSSEAEGKLTEMKVEVEHCKDLETQMYKVYEELCGKKTSYQEWKRVCQRDFYMPAHRAIEFGLIDKITGEK